MIETWLKSDLKRLPVVRILDGDLFVNDDGGTLIGVEVTDGGESVNLSGTVKGYFVLADGSTVEETGTISGNKAQVIMPEEAFAIHGRVDIAIKVGSVTVGACSGYVR